MKLIKYIFLLIIINFEIYSQGFDWQYSSRLPFKIPDFFIGIDAGTQYNFHNGSFSFCKGYSICDTFETGIGIGFSGGLKTEYWYSSNIAFNGSLVYNYIPGKFTSSILLKYPPEEGDLTGEYEYNSSQSLLLLDLGAKYRFFETHVFAGISLKTGILLNSSNEFILRTFNKKEFLAEEIIVANGEIPGLMNVFIIPGIKFGYDFNLGLGTYGSLYFGIDFPAQNIIEEGEWKRWSFSTGLNVYPYGF